VCIQCHKQEHQSKFGFICSIYYVFVYDAINKSISPSLGLYVVYSMCFVYYELLLLIITHGLLCANKVQRDTLVAIIFVRKT